PCRNVAAGSHCRDRRPSLGPPGGNAKERSRGRETTRRGHAHAGGPCFDGRRPRAGDPIKKLREEKTMKQRRGYGRWLACVLVLAGPLLLAAAAGAQTTASSIRGVVVDASGPLTD